jgi:hypothetical protein
MLRFLFPGLFLAAIIIAGCGSGGGRALVPAATVNSSPGPAASISPGPSPQTVTLTGAGYELQFTLPALFAGGGSLTATLQASPPSGVPVPSLKSRAAARTPDKVGSTVTSLVYLVVQASGTVQFTSIPSFVFTLPSATTIPSGSPSYVAFYDPTQQAANSGWIGVLGPGGVSGQTDTFAGVNSGVTLASGNTYVYALVYTSQAVPTATPAPTPTVEPSTGPTPQAHYCGSYVESGATPGLTLNITDDSGFSGSVLIVYVQQQGTPSAPGGQWMTATGSFGSTPVALPAACYSSTAGSGVANNPLVIPSGHAGRIYFVYASPAPTAAAAPNPFSGISAGGQPGVGISGQNAAPYPYDKIEYNSTAGVIDTTQVDFVGLPIEMNVVAGAATPLPQALPSACTLPAPTASPFSGVPAAGTVVGVGQCGYASVYKTLLGDSNYGSLVSVLPWGSQTIDFRAVSPAQAQNYSSFDFNLFGDPSVTLPSPTCTALVGSSTGTYGYMSCVLAQYAAHPQVFQAIASLGGNGDGDYFCISSDGVSNFIATDITPNTTCGSSAAPTSGTLPTNPFNIPVGLFTNAYYTSSGSSGSCFYGEMYTGPYGNANVGAGQMFATSDAFTLWKALELEMNYGTAFVQAPHPVETTPPSFQTTQGLFTDPLSNHYADYIHQYYDGNYAYAISYDDGFSWFSGYSITAPATINVRVNPVPTNAPATSAAPVPIASPACATPTLGVGSY